MKNVLMPSPLLRNTVHLEIDNTDVDLYSVTSKSLYNAFKMALK